MYRPSVGQVLLRDMKQRRMSCAGGFTLRGSINMGLEGPRFAGRTQSDQDNVLTSAGNKLPVLYKAEMSCVWERLLASE
jgi:hypothetical protein